VNRVPVRLGLTGPSGPLDATATPPGSKSETNRALVCAALAEGTSTIRRALLADDTEAMVSCLRGLGIDIARSGDTVVVQGCAGRVRPAGTPLDARLSGTTARFLAPVAALGPDPVELTGDDGLRARPMGDLVEALRTIGAGVDELGSPGHLPLRFGDPPLRGGRVDLPGDTSSQFLSGLLLAGPLMPAGLEVSTSTPLVSVPYVELTLDVMERFGAVVEGTPATVLSVARSGYRACDLQIEADASAASYFMAAPVIAGGRVRVSGVGSDSRQGDAVFADVLRSMGAAVTQGPDWTEVSSGGLNGVDVDLRDASDIAQTLAVVAAVASGRTRVRGIGFIRAKETDRISAVVRELRRVGIDAVEEEDGFTVEGGRPHGAVVRTYGDHRMAMSFALLSLCTPGIVIEDPDCVDKTYPDYFAQLASLIGAGPTTMASDP
jgi:3-phosphoshikimate 1-carboxyvinyltransferase